jgi:hypothetical protein
MSESTTTEGERRVLTESPSGEPVDLGDLSDGQRVVSADVIRRLCVGAEAKEVDPRGVHVRGARIVGPLDLSYCTVLHPLRFERTIFEAVPDLSGARLAALWITGCSLPGLIGDGIRLDDLRLIASDVHGELRLLNAKIGGHLDCSGATFSNEGGYALFAEGAEINGGVSLREGFRATGAVWFPVAKISGQLDCSGATLSNEGGFALLADEAEINGGVSIGRGFRAMGAVRLAGAKIGGQLDCSGATFGTALLSGVKISGALNCSGATFSNEAGDALDAEGAEISGDVSLHEGFSATGTVRLLVAKIGGRLDCSGATLSNEGGFALVADGAEINGGVYLRRLIATGCVSLAGVKSRLLDCPGARLHNAGGYALSASGVRVIGGVFLRHGFTAIGEVLLLSVTIGGDLDCSDATFSNVGSDALVVDGAEINGGVYLRRGFCSTGEVRFVGTKIGGALDCSDATLVNPSGVALMAEHAAVGTGLFFRDVHVTGGIDLFRASTTTLGDDLGRADDPLGSWQGIQPLILDGFAYERYGSEEGWDSKRREEWLLHTTGFQHGAWQQLIGVYRAHGRNDQANRAAIAMHNDRVKRAGLPWQRAAGRRVLGAVVGHGYRPWLAGAWGVAIIAAFALVVSHWSGDFVSAKGVTGSPQPVAYAADTFLPIIDLGQASDWTATHWLRWVDWSVILLGWALTTIFVAGFTRIVRSE